jgi:hypothetical protein
MVTARGESSSFFLLCPNRRNTLESRQDAAAHQASAANATCVLAHALVGMPRRPEQPVSHVFLFYFFGMGEATELGQ